MPKRSMRLHWPVVGKKGGTAKSCAALGKNLITILGRSRDDLDAVFGRIGVLKYLECRLSFQPRGLVKLEVT